MSVEPGPPGSGSKRLSPDELAQEIASLLKEGGSPRPERRRIDIVTVTRILMAFGVVVLGVGVAVAVPWIGGLAGYETPGTMLEGAAVVGCPGEPAIGQVFKGETVQVVGKTEDGHFYALRDGRGPGDVVYADAQSIGNLNDASRLPTRPCEPRTGAEILAAAAATAPDDPAPTTIPTSTTLAATTVTTTPGSTTIVPGVTVGRPPRRGTGLPGATTTTSTMVPGVPSPSTTTLPPSAPTTTTDPPSTTDPTSTTSSTSTSTTTTTTEPSTTTTEPPTTTTEP